MLRKIIAFSIRFPFLVLIFWALVVVFFVFQLPNIKQNNDFLSYLDKENPIVKVFDDIGKRFKGNSYGFVVIGTKKLGKTIFNVETLKHIDEITKFLENHKFVSDAFSIVNIDHIRKTEGGIEVSKLIEKLPTTQKECKLLEKKVMSDESYVGNMVSKDGYYANIVFKAINKAGIKKDVIAKDILEFIKKKGYKEEFYFGGVPFSMESAGRLIKRDIKTLTPLVLLLILGFLWISFRSFRGIFLPLLSVIISTISTMGLMALFQKPISIITSMLPVILIAVGSAYGIHYVNKYYSDEMTDDNKNKVIEKGASEIVLPVFMSALTTVIGFLSLITASIIIIRHFGVFTAIGIFIAFLTSSTIIPAVMSILKVKKEKHFSYEEKSGMLAKIMDRISSLVLGKTKKVIFFAIILFFVSLAFIPFIKREVNFILYLPKDNYVRKSEKILIDNFGGATPIQVLIKSKVKTPYTLYIQKRIRLYASNVPHLHNLQSLDKVIKDINYKLYDTYTIPENDTAVSNLYLFVDGKSFVEQMSAPKYNESLVYGVVDRQDTGILNEVVKDIKSFVEKTFASKKLVFLPYGDSYKKAYIEKVVGITADDIVYIFRSKGLSLTDNSIKRIKQILVDSFSFDVSKKPELMKKVEMDIRDYAISDEAEIEVNKDVVDDFVNEAILCSDESCVLSASLKYFKEGGELEDHKEFAKSIIYIKQKAMDRLKANYLYDEIIGVLGDKNIRGRLAVYDYKAFTKELRGEILDFLNGIFFVSPSEYKRITGQKPSDKQIHSFDIKVNGMAMVIVELDRSLVASQLKSLALAIVVVFILLSLEFRQISTGLIGIIPIVLTIAVLFAFMPILGIPLDTATGMIASIAIGIGIDYAIHFLSKINLLFAEGDINVDMAIDKTIHTSGRAILINAVSVMLGFLLLLLSVMKPLQNFGILTAITMVVSSISALTIMPSIIRLIGNKFFVRR